MRHPELDPEYIAAEDRAYRAALQAAEAELAEAQIEARLCQLRMNEDVARHTMNLAGRAEFAAKPGAPRNELRRRYDEARQQSDKASAELREALVAPRPRTNLLHVTARETEEERWRVFQRLNAEALAELLREEAARG